MFRLMRLKPPHGWNAVVWEFAIVTLIMLMALAAQQWADERTWRGKAEKSKAALRDELSEHYSFAVEFRTVYPCLQVQLAQLRNRVIASGAVMKPAPIHREPNYHYVVRIPSKEYSKEAWEAAINDGIVQRLSSSLRRILAGHYAVLGSIRDMNLANDQSEQELSVLGYRLTLDPMVHYSVIKDIELLSGRLELLDIINQELIDNIQRAKMLPPPEVARAQTEDFGTYKFCKAQALPMRSIKEAMHGAPS